VRPVIQGPVLDEAAPPDPEALALAAEALDDALALAHSVIKSWQTQASFTQQPIWKHGKHSSVHANSSHTPGVGTHIIGPLDELANPELDEATALETLETLEALADDELPVCAELLLVDDAPEPVAPPMPWSPPAPPEPATPSPSSPGNESLPVAQLAATVTVIPKARSNPASLCTAASERSISHGFEVSGTVTPDPDPDQPRRHRDTESRHGEEFWNFSVSSSMTPCLRG
jgi:hypothetical protein